MSLRLLSTKLAKHGRYFLQSFWKREIYTTILDQQQNRTRSRLPTAAKALKLGASVPSKYGAAKNAIQTGLGQTSKTAITEQPVNGIFRFGQHARKIFVDNILSRCTTTYSEELRSQATKKLFYGDSAPFFALIGVTLASGAGILTKEDELEGVCWEIREAAARLQRSWNYDDISETLNSDFNIDKLEVGPPIAKGCAAVVYAAAFKSDSISVGDVGIVDSAGIGGNSSLGGAGDGFYNNLQQQSFRPELMSPMQNMSRFVHNFGGSVDNLQLYNQSTAATDFVEALNSLQESERALKREEVHSTTRPGARSINGTQSMTPLNTTASIERYPLALKLMFNYDIQSNALSILRAMYKETVPARQRYINASAEEWERLIQDQTLTLPAHPNIVTMFGFFCDEVRNFPDGHLLYPIAQPQRINPLGYGRNMSLYLLMKRYDYCLRSLLDTQELKTRTKLLLLAQLFEAVAHINRHGIAHRDLKSDNILIEMNDDDSPPILVLSDFGCCLADKIHGLQIPFTSYDIDKGGNAALMAPEIINKQPGPFSVLNYAKADLWACGAIAYEIFGMPNPFYSSSGGMAIMTGQQTYSLRNSDYKHEDLPPLTDDCPELMKQLIYNILHPNPSKRLSPDIAANVIQLFLWAPSKWLKTGGLPNSPEILQWLLSLTTKIMCEGRTFNAGGVQEQFGLHQSGRRTYVEYLLICSFLARAQLRRIRGALNWIQNIV